MPSSSTKTLTLTSLLLGTFIYLDYANGAAIPQDHETVSSNFIDGTAFLNNAFKSVLGQAPAGAEPDPATGTYLVPSTAFDPVDTTTAAQLAII